MRILSLVIVVYSGFSASICSADVVPTTQTEPSFDVASVRENTSQSTRSSASPGLMPNLWGQIVPAPGRLDVTNMPLREIIARAYEIQPGMERFLLTGGDDRVLSKRFDISAAPPDGASPGEKLAMLRALLMDRFGLRLRRERRRTPVYTLTVARAGKLGPQLKPSTRDCTAPGVLSALARGEAADAEGRFLCREGTYEFNKPGAHDLTMRFASPVDVMVTRVRSFFDRPIVNATGLTGSYEWALSFSLRFDVADDLSAPSIFVAFQEQLGLKLEPRMAPFEVFAIESVNMPTPN